MAERSFVEEVKKLRLGDGEVFRGEGILAVTKALLESGVSYVAGYQGAPISHLMDVLADAQDILAELGVHFENSASEATAAATLAASVNYPLRGAVTFKSTVGTNVASDALANLASGGVTGGALVIVGEDYGEGSSIMQERSHAFAMKSQIWLLDPRPNLPIDRRGGEARLRAVGGQQHAGDAAAAHPRLPRARPVHRRATTAAPAFTLARGAGEPAARRRAASCCRRRASCTSRRRCSDRWPAAVHFIEERGLNEFFAEDADDIGIIVQGGMLQHAGARARAARPGRRLRPLAGAALRDERHLSGGRRARSLRFCAGKRAVLMVEEGQPELHRAEPGDRSCARPTRRPRCTARTCCRWPANTPAARC